MSCGSSSVRFCSGVTAAKSPSEGLLNSILTNPLAPSQASKWPSISSGRQCLRRAHRKRRYNHHRRPRRQLGHHLRRHCRPCLWLMPLHLTVLLPSRTAWHTAHCNWCHAPQRWSQSSCPTPRSGSGLLWRRRCRTKRRSLTTPQQQQPSWQRTGLLCRTIAHSQLRTTCGLELVGADLLC